MKYIEIQTTFETEKEAEEMASLLISKKVAACCQIEKIKSIFQWEGKTDNQTEYRLSIKSKEDAFREVEKTIINNHSYDLPQIISFPINGSKKYLDWVDKEIN